VGSTVKPWTQSPKDDNEDRGGVCRVLREWGRVEWSFFGCGADRTRGRGRRRFTALQAMTWTFGGVDIFGTATRPNLAVEVEELRVPEGTGRLLVVRVPRGEHPPYGTAQGLYKQRVGKNCMPMDGQSFVRSQVSAGALDWSGEAARQVSAADLDLVEIARARNLLMRDRADSGLLGPERFGSVGGFRCGSQRSGDAYGIVAFRERGENSGRFALSTKFTTCTRSTGMQVSRNDSYQAGLLNVLEKFEQIFTSPANPEQELAVGLFRLRIPSYPVEVVREAVLTQ